jgi:CDP-diacylglycerol--glycerol-3-phosphate 3-phosphatidyltransferase
MLNNDQARGAIRPIVEPVARALLRMHVTPDMVTLTGTALATTVALVLIPRGYFLPAVGLLLLLTTSDLLDGTMARLSGTQGPWGAWLDATLDRVADGAIFGGLLIWAAWTDRNAWATAMGLICLVGGQVISYAKARAEAVGATANVGIAERAERMIIAALGAIAQGLGVDWGIAVALTVLAILNIITVIQRATAVRSQLKPRPGAPAAAGE